MRNANCADLLQWALSHLDLDWPGYRKVRSQVCKRIRRRMRTLGIASFAAYRQRLESDSGEWAVLDSLCHITISRFCRDRAVFEVLAECILPTVAKRARAERRKVRVWSAGCASGEEPYTIKIFWDLRVSPRVPNVALSITATDVDETMLARAREACYPAGSLRELPPELSVRAFERRDGRLCLRAVHRQGIAFLRQDLRTEAPQGPFDLVLCRNLAFTYFTPALQERVLHRITATLREGGILVIGGDECLPWTSLGLRPVAGSTSIFLVGEPPGSRRVSPGAGRPIDRDHGCSRG